MYKPAQIDFNDSQIKKIIGGKPIKLSASQIGSGSKTILLHPANHRIVSKAKMSGKGCVIEVSPAEVLCTVESDINGTGFFGDLWKGIKSGWKWVKNNIIETPLYQSTLKPIIRQGVDSLAQAAKAVIPGNIDDKLIDEGVKYLGNKSNAFGIKKKGRRRKTDNVLMNGGSFRLN